MLGMCRIEVGEIERHLTSSTYEALHHGVVDKIESETMPPSLVAFIVLSPNSPLLFDISPFTSVAIQPFFNSPSFHQIVDEIRSKMAESLPSYMVPRYWLPITHIPTQGMGKTDRKSLRLLAQSHNFSRGSTKQSTQDKWHDAVRDAWGQVLKGEEGGMGDEDEFTKLGGDSIGFLRVIGLLRTAGYSVSFSDLISASSLSDCARVLRASPTQSRQPPTADYVPFSLLDPLTLPSILAELSTDFSILSTDIIDVYPTSPSQDSLLAASLESTHYYAQAVYALDDSIGLGTIERALGRLVARHEVLRTCFVVLDATERTLQVVLSSDNEQVKACVTVERVEVEEGESQVCIDVSAFQRVVG
jgi:aryl carrier-like protein